MHGIINVSAIDIILETNWLTEQVNGKVAPFNFALNGVGTAGYQDKDHRDSSNGESKLGGISSKDDDKELATCCQ